jgi:hypothetical protein
MAKHKRKHHSRGAMNGHMRMAHDRRGHDMGEHLYMSGSGEDRQASSSQGYRPRADYGESFQERMDLNKRMRIMNTNNGNMGPIREDFSRPCGLPYGAIQRDLGNGDYYSMNGYRVGDLYEQVDKTMREDAAALKSITKPANW